MNITRLQLTSNHNLDAIIQSAHSSNFPTKIPFGHSNCLDIFMNSDQNNDLTQLLHLYNLNPCDQSIVRVDIIKSNTMNDEIIQMLTNLKVKRRKVKKLRHKQSVRS